MQRIREAGFSAVEALVIIVMLAGLGGIGYVAVNRMNKTDTATNTTTTNTSTATDDLEAPDIKTKSDLSQAEQTLKSDSADLDAADSELNTELDTF